MRRFAVLITVFGLVFALAAPAAAAPPQYVSFEGPALFAGSGTFETTNGPLCPIGTTEDLLVQTVSSNPNQTRLRVVKEFTCDNGSPSFTIELKVRIRNAGTWFTWKFIDGHEGRGFGWVNPSIPVADGVYDMYVGFVR